MINQSDLESMLDWAAGIDSEDRRHLTLDEIADKNAAMQCGVDEAILKLIDAQVQTGMIEFE
jgi:hypothetical protein